MATPTGSPKAAPARGWALDTTEVPIRTKPRRPYTPYNLFYLLERELVVQGNDPSVAEQRAEKRAKMEADPTYLAKVGERAENDIPMPPRYEGVVMLPWWFEPNLKEKRKHRKTHGTISFKDLTEIISKNWATIDAETKEYCTRVSEIGRKRYKEDVTKYNASQKIIQLKKEKAAMENARKHRVEHFQAKKAFNSPPRQEKTPDRIMSQAPVVTPQSAYSNSNRLPMFLPSGPVPFHPYGPPPPLPPPMPHSVPSRSPPAMPMYHQSQQQQQPQAQFRYQPSSAHKANKGPRRKHPVMAHTAPKHSRGRGGVGVTVDVNVRLNDEGASKRSHVAQAGASAFRSNMTHDEAKKLGNLLGVSSPGNAHFPDTLLGEAPSFDFADHHSLSTEDGDHMSRGMAHDAFLNHVENQDDHYLDLIRGELLPLGPGDEEHFGFSDL
ncbi:hypothetical protein ACHAXT_004509 [Thalassiosira profunda]